MGGFRSHFLESHDTSPVSTRKIYENNADIVLLSTNSLAWVELKLTMCKILHRYHFALAEEVDWQAESEMHLLWKKPALKVILQNKRGM
jgi:hypothetical protein